MDNYIYFLLVKRSNYLHTTIVVIPAISICGSVIDKPVITNVYDQKMISDNKGLYIFSCFFKGKWVPLATSSHSLDFHLSVIIMLRSKSNGRVCTWSAEQVASCTLCHGDVPSTCYSPSLCLIIDGINGASSVSVLYKLLDLFTGIHENIN